MFIIIIFHFIVQTLAFAGFGIHCGGPRYQGVSIVKIPYSGSLGSHGNFDFPESLLEKSGWRVSEVTICFLPVNPMLDVR